MPLLRRGLEFVVGRFFQYQACYLREFATEDIRKFNEADFRPKIDNFTLRIISTNQEAAELEAEGLEFRSHVINARQRLDKGAIAFCIFSGRELANMAWLAMTQKAKDSLCEAPFKVDFSNNEGWSGGLWTNPKYRRRGLAEYGTFKRLEFGLGTGIVTNRAAVAKGNIASQRATATFSPKIYAEGRYLKILWWKSCKEKPLT